jgi:hypothetical protein
MSAKTGEVTTGVRIVRTVKEMLKNLEEKLTIDIVLGLITTRGANRSKTKSIKSSTRSVLFEKTHDLWMTTTKQSARRCASQ